MIGKNNNQGGLLIVILTINHYKPTSLFYKFYNLLQKLIMTDPSVGDIKVLWSHSNVNYLVCKAFAIYISQLKTYKLTSET